MVDDVIIAGVGFVSFSLYHRNLLQLGALDEISGYLLLQHILTGLQAGEEDFAILVGFLGRDQLTQSVRLRHVVAVKLESNSLQGQRQNVLGIRVFPVCLFLQADGAKLVVFDSYLGGAGVSGGHLVEVVLHAGLKGVADRRSGLFHIIGGVRPQIGKLHSFLAGNRLQHLAALILRLIPQLKFRGLHGFAGNGATCLGIDLDHLHRLDLGVLYDDILSVLLRCNLVRRYGIGAVNGLGIGKIAARGIQFLQVIFACRQQTGQRRAGIR